MMGIVIIGVDPGSRYTGLVVRFGNDVVDHAVLDAGKRPRRRALPPKTYVWDVVDWVAAMQVHVLSFGHEVRIAVEGLVEPSAYIDGEKAMLTDPATHMGVSMVFAGVTTAFRDVVEVRPGGHGHSPLSTYPPDLIGPREKRQDSQGILGHARSAWDIAGAAMKIIRAPALAWVTGDP